MRNFTRSTTRHSGTSTSPRRSVAMRRLSASRRIASSRESSWRAFALRWTTTTTRRRQAWRRTTARWASSLHSAKLPSTMVRRTHRRLCCDGNRMHFVRRRRCTRVRVRDCFRFGLHDFWIETAMTTTTTTTTVRMAVMATMVISSTSSECPQRVTKRRQRL
ncbi:mitogen-activated protein kinase kinase kinase [Pycnococcus provasolii]